MFEKLGIVTNIWADRLEKGDRFEDLAEMFGKNGFLDMEIRDGEYLRNSEFGSFVQGIEEAMGGYSHERWKILCEARGSGCGELDFVEKKDRMLFDAMEKLEKRTGGAVFSYAVSHSWMSPFSDADADNLRITWAAKLAYFFNPRKPRLRLVDRETTGKINPSAGVENLKKYCRLLSGFPVLLVIENSRQPAPLTMDLAVEGGAFMAYDEANVYGTDGTVISSPEKFWESVKTESLVSVHFKQKTGEGVLPRVGDGFVDFSRIVDNLKSGKYGGDLLLENKPSDDPLKDAVLSREYLKNL